MGLPTGRVTTPIITGGMGVNIPACQGLIMTTPFQLLCILLPGVSGGGIPLQPGEIHDFYKPVDPKLLKDLTEYPSEHDGELVDLSVYGKKKVKVIITSSLFKGEKEFVITEKQRKILIEVGNFINVTQKHISVIAENIRNIASRAKVIVENFRWHK